MYQKNRCWNNVDKKKRVPRFCEEGKYKNGEKVAILRKKEMMMKFKNKSYVLVSTFHGDSKDNVTTREQVIQKPSDFLYYNKTWGVDRKFGQLKS